MSDRGHYEEVVELATLRNSLSQTQGTIVTTMCYTSIDQALRCMRYVIRDYVSYIHVATLKQKIAISRT